MNFSSNAIKFSRDNGQVCISCRTSQRDTEGQQKLDIVIEDRGVGISEENQAKLFKMFGQVQQSGDELSTAGLGMGLYLTKLIVTQFSGEVSVQSVLGQGSQFGFTFEISEQNQV